jgi:spore maturation protein CgeB
VKIIILGSKKESSLESIYLKYLSEMANIDVIIYDSFDQFENLISKNLIFRVINFFQFSPIYLSLNKRIKLFIEINSPDIVLIFKGMEVLPSTIKWIKKQNIKVTNFNPDNPFIFSGRGSGNCNVKKSVGLYDMHFTYDKFVRDKILTDYSLPCFLLEFGFDEKIISEEDLIKTKEINAICFLGNPDKYRAKQILYLAKLGLRIHVYSDNWKKYISHPNVVQYNTIYGTQFYLTLKMYRVQLNIMREHNLESHNMRTFEIPGSGGIMLAPRTADHQRFFIENQEVFFYDNLDNLAIKANQILNMSETDVAIIRAQARRKTIGNFTYANRARQMINYLSAL